MSLGHNDFRDAAEARESQEEEAWDTRPAYPYDPDEDEPRRATKDPRPDPRTHPEAWSE